MHGRLRRLAQLSTSLLVVGALLALLLVGCGGCGGDGGDGGRGQGPDEHPNDPFYGVISAEPLPGDWADWPWTLLPLVPEASRAAWDQPSTIIWHFQLDDR